MQQPHHLLVGRLTKVRVPLTDGVERLGSLDADHLVSFALELRNGVAWCDGDCEQRAARALRLRDSERGASRTPGGQAVVDHDDRPPRQGDRRPAAPEQLRAALGFRPLAALDRRDLLGREAGESYDFLVEDAHAALTDRAHRELRLERDTEFADDDDVQRRAQRPGDLGRDGNAPSRQSDHDAVLVPEVRHCLGEPPAGLDPVPEAGPAAVHDERRTTRPRALVSNARRARRASPPSARPRTVRPPTHGTRSGRAARRPRYVRRGAPRRRTRSR